MVNFVLTTTESEIPGVNVFYYHYQNQLLYHQAISTRLCVKLSSTTLNL